LLAALLVLVAGLASAAGLGRLTVLSALGQPFSAEIELTATKEELGSLSVRLADAEAYRQANLQYNPALAGARLSIERRPNGQPYIRITTTRPVAEPFIDLLVELNWATGRILREYTALLDPPGLMPSPPVPAVAAVPETRPAPPPVAAVPAPARAPAPMIGAKEYGPVQRGETLGKIARSVKPEGVTLEQMLIGLYRSNPDAFVRNNLNLLRSGKVLRVPEREEIAAISPAEALKEYRAQVADWNSYRQRLADAAGTVPAAGRTAVSGRISASVQDQAASAEPKDVVRVSKGEPPEAAKGKPLGAAERARVLEEELVAREKALAEAKERIAQLEKTIKDMQKLIELKSPGLATAQQQAQQVAKPEAPAPKPEVKPEAKPELKPEIKPEAVALAKPEPAKPAETPQPQAAKPEPVKPEAAASAEKPAEAPKAEAPKPAAEKMAAPAPKPKAAPPPPPEPDLVDQIFEAASDPLYLAAGGGVIVLGGLALWMARRRRVQAGGAGAESERVVPSLAPAAAAAGAAAVAAATPAATATVEEVDPLAEAEVYIAYGRDAQAEEILKEAMARSPAREDVQLKLLEIYSARRDKQAFGQLAAGFHKLTGGAGEHWLKAAAMGYALDPNNVLYEAGRTLAAPATAAPEIDLDLDLGAPASTATTDITLEAGPAQAAAGTDTVLLDVGEASAAAQKPAAGPLMPDFQLEIPPAGETATQTDIVLEAAAPAKDENVIDFQIELPKIEETPTATAQPEASAGLEFKLEVPDLDLGGEPKSAAAGGEKDGHWYDVQTKFDLAKAYQEMGDKDGAKEILQEVLKEGDAEQKAQARSLLESLG
jgi:pilus assembly protein FimV